MINHIEKIDVKTSATIDSFEYDNLNHSLTVNFKSGARYLYEDVDHSTATEFKLAESKGKFLIENVRDKFIYRRLDSIDQK